MKKYRAYIVWGNGSKHEQWEFSCEVKTDSVEVFCYKTLIDNFPTKSHKFTTKQTNSVIWTLEIYDDYFKVYQRGSGTPIIFELIK